MSQEIRVGDNIFFVPVVGYQWLDEYVKPYEHKKVVSVKVIDNHHTVSFNGVDFYPSYPFSKVV